MRARAFLIASLFAGVIVAAGTATGWGTQTIAGSCAECLETRCDYENAHPSTVLTQCPDFASTSLTCLRGCVNNSTDNVDTCIADCAPSDCHFSSSTGTTACIATVFAPSPTSPGPGYCCGAETNGSTDGGIDGGKDGNGRPDGAGSDGSGRPDGAKPDGSSDAGFDAALCQPNPAYSNCNSRSFPHERCCTGVPPCECEAGSPEDVLLLQCDPANGIEYFCAVKPDGTILGILGQDPDSGISCGNTPGCACDTTLANAYFTCGGTACYQPGVPVHRVSRGEPIVGDRNCSIIT
jgi:hypothetical protein